MIVINY